MRENGRTENDTAKVVSEVNAFFFLSVSPSLTSVATVYTWYDGDLYTGPWKEGRRHGHGVFVFSDGRLYDGEYNMGQREGQGMFVWPYGAKYEGSYNHDKRNGFGEYVYADGRVYRGEYKDDRPHGYGVEVAKDGGVLYDGNWAFGEFLGDGVSMAGSIISHRVG
jgi:hypothetical protein